MKPQASPLAGWHSRSSSAQHSRPGLKAAPNSNIFREVCIRRRRPLWWSKALAPYHGRNPKDDFLRFLATAGKRGWQSPVSERNGDADAKNTPKNSVPEMNNP